MIKPVHYLIISSAMLLIGMLFYGIYNDLILIRLPFAQLSAPFHTQTNRKTINLTYWNGTKWIAEEKEILFSSAIARTLQELITSWLTLLEEDRRTMKKVSLQSALIDQAGTEAFISFDRNPLAKEQSTLDKLLWLEGLLNTIRASGLPIQTVRFLVNGKPLIDTHLDFSHSWPVTGYTQSSPASIITKK